MEIIKLHPEIAAEIRGVSMADVANNDDAYRAVREYFGNVPEMHLSKVSLEGIASTEAAESVMTELSRS